MTRAHLLTYSLTGLLSLAGCSYKKHLGTVEHIDGSGRTRYDELKGGGFLRPGVIVIVSQTYGSNPPVVLTQASGAPIAPGLLGAPSQIAEAALIGRGLAKSGNSTTVVESSPPPAPIPDDPPKPPDWPPGHRPKPHGNHGR